ncbi:enoyl-CoA hydratase [Amycolatopsis acidicola]|uniref:Enoyl-CoA hydratase n=1 Tax=Amycolatopsis acidicola TaxID=2596893 RepID=A0A5N0URI8_9PSEU|nr:enoyl-CoA hydratase-related protein [Amycolatopsis acidicola]KAA9153446.1 enoyl-CoA hydratase [Amycolatopsis acidicola]
MHVRYEVSGHVAVVTLDRPGAMNAFTDEMESGLIECFDRADGDDDVRAVVLTGAGSAFCAGMDLGSAAEGVAPFAAWRASESAPPGTQDRAGDGELPLRRDGGGRVALRIFDARKPVLAAINGHAVGVGITMTLPCDLRLAADEAKIAFPFARRGFVPESCSSWFLPRLVPPQRALEWMLTGRTVSSEEARESGLVLSVHPAGSVLDAALELASRIAATAPVSSSYTRRLLWRMLTASHPMEAHRVETLALNEFGISEDAEEGVAAFLDKRTPSFTGRVSAAPDFLAGLPRPGYRPTKGSS